MLGTEVPVRQMWSLGSMNGLYCHWDRAMIA